MDLNQKQQLIFKYTKQTFFLTPSKKYIMIKTFKDEIEGLKNILTEIKKTLELLGEQEINEIKSKTKRKLNMLDDEINNILGKFYLDLATLRLRCEFFT